MINLKDRMARANRFCKRKSSLLHKRILATVLEHVDEQNQQEEAGLLKMTQHPMIGTVGFSVSKDPSRTQGQVDASGLIPRSAERRASTHNPQDHCCDCPYCRHPPQRGSGTQRVGHRQVENQLCPLHGERLGQYKTGPMLESMHSLLNCSQMWNLYTWIQIGLRLEHRLRTVLKITPKNEATFSPATHSKMPEITAAADNDVKDLAYKLGNLFSPPHKHKNEEHFFPRKLDTGKPFVVDLEVRRGRVAPGIAQRVTCQPEEQRCPVNKFENLQK
ncbi:hypothetical protein Ocin01_05318 [Orchesella cincta]|uniref:Uncharacterized protein n=1 Tax=Orchesella cincta TaxID=48709 RepID=A0A1D2N7W8_ORCCI|nr:hypothetical protein Ocin01_05318 [Orchesella cincta]